MIVWRPHFLGYGLIAVASFAGCQLVSGVDSVEYEEDGSGAGATAAETTASAASTAAAGMGGAGGATSSQTTTTAASMAQTTSTGSATSPCNGNGTCDEAETKCACPLECPTDNSCDNNCCDPSADTNDCGVGRNIDCQALPNCTVNAGSGQGCNTADLNCGNCTSCKCPKNQHCAFLTGLGHMDCTD